MGLYMPNSKLVEGFLILTRGKIPKNLVCEVKHYNNLIAIYDKMNTFLKKNFKIPGRAIIALCSLI